LHRSATVGNGTIISSGCSIGANSTVLRSVIGNRCIIGRNVHIEDSYIMDDCVISDDTRISRSVLASEVVISKRNRIQDGACLSWGVRTSDGVTVTGKKIIRKRIDDETKKEDSDYFSAVGEKGEGFEYQPSNEDDDGAADTGLSGSRPSSTFPCNG
jgi:translation initiation factor eIF-2B subunit epsilon